MRIKNYRRRPKRVVRRHCKICRKQYYHNFKWCFSQLLRAGAIQPHPDRGTVLTVRQNPEDVTTVYKRLDSCFVEEFRTIINGNLVRVKPPRCFFPKQHCFYNGPSKPLQVLEFQSSLLDLLD
jgi:hypothetical protein